MCLINFQWHTHPNYPLIVAANRDELYERPTAPAHFWQDYPFILAGRDLQQHGTWLGITTSGRFAALTNYRDPQMMYETFEKSRGDLVKDFLTSSSSPVTYLENIQPIDSQFNGFNLLVGTVDDLFYYNNIERKIVKIVPGTHSLSNHFLNTPWPKVVRGKNTLQAIAKQYEQLTPDHLFPLLADREQAPKHKLPNTGIDQVLEKKLSPLFIQTPTYGTRSSTALFIDKNGRVTFNERTYSNGSFKNELAFNFHIQKT